jgi:hypothetical protein
MFSFGAIKIAPYGAVLACYVTSSPSVRFHTFEFCDVLIEFKIHYLQVEIAQPIANACSHVGICFIRSGSQMTVPEYMPNRRQQV